MTEMLKEIQCQACVGQDPEDGCATCGGSKVLLTQRPVCKKCGRLGWMGSGVHTMYNGKRFTSFDGVPLVVRGWETVCGKCDADFD